MSVRTLSIELVSLPMNFSAFASPETIADVGVDKSGYAILKGTNGNITVAKLIPNPDCPSEVLAVPRSLQLTLSVCQDDTVPILPFSESGECDAVQVAPLFDRARDEDLTKPLQKFLAQKRPVCSGTVFSLRVGGEERLFMFGKAHPADRTFSSNSTRVFVIAEPGPLLPRPPLSVKLPALALDPAVVNLMREAFLGPSKNSPVFSALQVNTSTGALVYGPDGSGKTSLVSAVADLLGIPSIYCACRRYGKMSAAEVTEKLQVVFGFVNDKEQCLVMLDDLDAILQPLARCKLVADRRKVAAFVTMLDEVMRRSGVFVIATCESLDDVDECLLRQGRFEHQIAMNFPTFEQRQQIIRMNTGGMRIDRDDLREVAENMGDARSASEIEGLCRFAVYQLIEEVTGSSRSNISDSLLVYALNTKMRAFHFGIKGSDDRRRRHRRHRHSRRPHGRRARDEYDSDESDDSEDERRHSRRRQRR